MKEDLKKIIIDLMRENTGIHFLDSGGENGRAYQKNQAREIIFGEPLEFEEGYGITIPIQDYMYAHFEIDEFCEAMNGEIQGNDTLYWIEEVYEYLSEKYELTTFRELSNTFNYDNNLSQNFAFKVIELYGEFYCLFQLHNGADIRGGYTKTRVFKINDIDYFFSGMLVAYSVEINGTAIDFYDYWDLERYAEESNLEITEKEGVGYLDGYEIQFSTLLEF